MQMFVMCEGVSLCVCVGQKWEIAKQRSSLSNCSSGTWLGHLDVLADNWRHIPHAGMGSGVSIIDGKLSLLAVN